MRGDFTINENDDDFDDDTTASGICPVVCPVCPCMPLVYTTNFYLGWPLPNLLIAHHDDHDDDEFIDDDEDGVN